MVVKPSIIVLLCALLSGCGAIIKARYYQPTPEGDVPYRVIGPGVAIKSGDVCVWISEGNSKATRTVSTGPFLPIIPVGVGMADPIRQDYEKILISLIPSGKYLSIVDRYTFDPSGVSLVYNNGAVATPLRIRVTRYKTSWKRQKMNLFGPGMIEIVNIREVGLEVDAKDFQKPVALWSQTEIELMFIHPAAGLVPEKLLISGLVGDGRPIEIPVVRLAETEKTVYTGPDQFVVGEWFGRTPTLECRRLLGDPL